MFHSFVLTKTSSRRNRPGAERCLHRIANRFFIAVAFRTIEMSESGFQRRLGRFFGHERIAYQRAKATAGIAADPSGRESS